MRATAFLIAGLLALAGCGGASPQLAPIERDELHGFVERARTAARLRDLRATNAALEGLRARVRELRGAGRLDREAADQLLKYSAVTQLRARKTLGAAAAAAGQGAAVTGGEGDADAGDGDAKDLDGGDANAKGRDRANEKARGNGNGKGKGKN